MRIRMLLGPRSGDGKIRIRDKHPQHCKKPCINLCATLPLDLLLHISSAQIFGQKKLIHLLKDQKGLKNAKTPAPTNKDPQAT
jgi:hypothetical protein